MVAGIGAVGELAGYFHRRRALGQEDVHRPALQGAPRGGGHGFEHGFADEVVPEGQALSVFHDQARAQQLLDRGEQRGRRLLQHGSQLIMGKAPAQHSGDPSKLLSRRRPVTQPDPHRLPQPGRELRAHQMHPLGIEPQATLIP